MIKTWRTRRRLSQLDLALDAHISARHLSFVETGRSRPSEQMVLHLAKTLDVPLRERNRLLLAAGYAPVYSQHSLHEPELAPIRSALDQLLKAHEPFPAVVVDRQWNLVAGNSAVALLTAGVAEHLLKPPVNVLKIALHPEGMAPRITNLGEWRAHLLRDVAAQNERRPRRALRRSSRAIPDPTRHPARTTCSSHSRSTASNSSAPARRSGQRSM